MLDECQEKVIFNLNNDNFLCWESKWIKIKITNSCDWIMILIQL